MAPDLQSGGQLVALFDTSESEIHGFRLSLALGGPKVAATNFTKCLYPPITALSNLDIVSGVTSYFNIRNRGRQDSSKWCPRKYLAICAVACDYPRRIHGRLKGDCTAKTLPCYFHARSFQAVSDQILIHQNRNDCSRTHKIVPQVPTALRP